jgi:hypothetical protein
MAINKEPLFGRADSWFVNLRSPNLPALFHMSDKDGDTTCGLHIPAGTDHLTGPMERWLVCKRCIRHYEANMRFYDRQNWSK